MKTPTETVEIETQRFEISSCRLRDRIKLVSSTQPVWGRNSILRLDCLRSLRKKCPRSSASPAPVTWRLPSSPSISREEPGSSSNSSDAKSMADGNSENDAWTNLSPRIIFVRLGKDKSKDAVEDELFKCINQVLGESNDNGSVLEKAKNCISLPDFGSSRIIQVAVGPEFLGLLFNDGRVCRVKCVTRNLDSIKKLSSSLGNSDEPLFQVQSDEAYARQLQNEFLNNGATTRTVPSRSLVSGSAMSSSPSPSSFRASGRSGFGNVFVSNRTKARFASWMPNTSSTTTQTPVTRESQTGKEELEKPNNTSSNLVEGSGSSNHETQVDTAMQTSSSVKTENLSKDASNGGVPSSNATKADNEAKAENQKPKGSDSGNQRQENSLDSLSAGSNPRRSVSSPTLLHRTVFTTTIPGNMRQWPAFLLPITGSVPLMPRRSNLQPHVVRAQLAEAGAFPRGPTTANIQRPDDRASSESKTASSSDADFCYPEIGDIQWLEAENVSETTSLNFINSIITQSDL